MNCISHPKFKDKSLVLGCRSATDSRGLLGAPVRRVVHGASTIYLYVEDAYAHAADQRGRVGRGADLLKFVHPRRREEGPALRSQNVDS